MLTTLNAECVAEHIKSDLTTLNEIVDLWKRERMLASEAEWSRFGYPDEMIVAGRQSWDQQLTEMADRARKALPHLLACNDGAAPEELEAIAADLSPGGAHDSGWLTNLIAASPVMMMVDPLLLAALYAYNWHGGKAGFQFMPDARRCSLLDYNNAGTALLESIAIGTDADPRKILTGEDRAFFDSLPDRFFIYRGCPGISAEMAAAGICWTVNKPMAQWFANRGYPQHSPTLVGAWVNKGEVAFVKASEFEVVVQPRKARQLKCQVRPQGPRPEPSAFQL